ncbi:MAG: pitrilysin family protein [Candidatus Saccharimonadales bacterium]
MKHTVTEVALNNGAKGLFIHVPDATVMNFEVNFRAGEYLVSQEKWETPHLMEHVLLGANELIPKARLFQAEFEKNGAYSNASTGTYDITYEAECADFEWDRIADLLLTAITKPLFLEEEFSAEFGNVREELTARSNNHFRHLSLALRQSYGFVVLTDQERLRLMENVVLNDLRQHYMQTHTTRNMRFVIAGKLPQTRRKLLQSLLENIELTHGEKRISLPLEQPHSLVKPLYIHNDTIENLYFYMDTFMKRRMSDNEADALNLINIMLTETLYSRILGSAREKGLVYSMSSGIGQNRDSSNWWFGAQVMPKNVDALFNIILRELEAVFMSDIAEDDIAAAKQYALGRFQRSGQTVSGTAAGYSGRYFFDDVIDDYYLVPKRIEAVTKEGIVKISRELFADHIWGLGGLGSCGEDFIQQLHQVISPLWQ